MVWSAIAHISNSTARTNFGTICIAGNRNAFRHKPILPNDIATHECHSTGEHWTESLPCQQWADKPDNI